MELIIQAVEKGERGAFVAITLDKQLAGEMTFTKSNDTLIIIDHTGVEPAFEGQGVGKQLAKYAINYIREKGWKVIPLCPFAKGYFQKHTDEVKDIV